MTSRGCWSGKLSCGMKSNFLVRLKGIILVFLVLIFILLVSVKVSRSDTRVSIKGGKFSTDQYKKPTDRCQYLLPSSCHPAHIAKNIPYNLAYRILRICSEPEDLEKRFGELKKLLLEREYRERCIDDAIRRVMKISRREALKKVEKRKNERPVFAITYNPSLPSVSHILNKHWRVMKNDPYLKKVFPLPPHGGIQKDN